MCPERQREIGKVHGSGSWFRLWRVVARQHLRAPLDVLEHPEASKHPIIACLATNAISRLRAGNALALLAQPSFASSQCSHRLAFASTTHCAPPVSRSAQIGIMDSNPTSSGASTLKQVRPQPPPRLPSLSDAFPPFRSDNWLIWPRVSRPSRPTPRSCRASAPSRPNRPRIRGSSICTKPACASLLNPNSEAVLLTRL